MLKDNKKIPERRHWRCFGVFIVNFEHISHLFLVFLLLNLSRYLNTFLTFQDKSYSEAEVNVWCHFDDFFRCQRKFVGPGLGFLIIQGGIMELQQRVAQAPGLSYAENQIELSLNRVSLKDEMVFLRTVISSTA